MAASAPRIKDSEEMVSSAGAGPLLRGSEFRLQAGLQVLRRSRLHSTLMLYGRIIIRPYKLGLFDPPNEF
jgi:hypothetical protein